MISGPEARVLELLAEALRATYAVHTGAKLPTKPDRDPAWTADRFTTTKG